MLAGHRHAGRTLFVTLKWRFNFPETLRSIEFSSSEAALTDGEMFAPALAEATAVPEAEGDGAGVGYWPSTVKAKAIDGNRLRAMFS